MKPQKRILALLLAAMMTAPALVACSETGSTVSDFWHEAIATAVNVNNKVIFFIVLFFLCRRTFRSLKMTEKDSE